MKNFLLLIFIPFITYSCKNFDQDMRKFETVLEDSTGHNHTIVKAQTETTGYVVYKDETTGEYTAYNINAYNRNTMRSLSDYRAHADANDVISDLNEYREWKIEGYYETNSNGSTIWVDTSHWYTYYTGGGYRFENNSTQSKDLETLAALGEEAAEMFIAHKLSSDFSLSDQRASELARLTIRYQKLESHRELTSSEKDQFALKALGVSFKQIEDALKNGDESYDALLETAAIHNRSTPEKIGKFFQDYIIE